MMKEQNKYFNLRQVLNVLVFLFWWILLKILTCPRNVHRLQMTVGVW